MSYNDDRQEDYLKEYIKKQTDETQCDICFELITNNEFLKHLEDCAEMNKVSGMKKKAIFYRFMSSEYSINQQFSALREKLELEIMTSDFESVFKQEGETIVGKTMAHFGSYLYLEKQLGLEEIEKRYEESDKLEEEKSKFFNERSAENLEEYRLKKKSVKEELQNQLKRMMEYVMKKKDTTHLTL
ncbi:hypothetical protein GCK72_007723 [Caenorhabditis remanei]|uniref:Uncharacterized protein n=1 Tax=Caenorhabditis remanei TaxID=31234 RepID=A0A6A5HMD3_CAERE|nr:hypothetical protein GCK72_007723 [Caenorhabditis remanei]KAF1767764.1 hypothetical protein GCK72_007723 [Caenorhabditis remanei]